MKAELNPACAPFDITSKVVWVTGASSGIGLHLAGMFSHRGATVIATARSASRSESLQTLVQETGRLRLLDMDVSNEASVAAATAQAQAEFGRVDVLINNAGAALERTVLDTAPSEWNKLIATNLTGPFMLSRAVIPLMPAGGSIVNVSSIAAHKGIRTLSAYAASKAGLEQFSRVLALELAVRGVRVNTVVPGYIRTPMNQDYLASEASLYLKRSIPFGRFGETSDLDGVMLLLTSDASSYMTGACLAVDGGYML
jgi:3-oxoacyl-[acyl-carrier protein] reductase